MSPEQQLTASYLDRAMAEFDSNPVAVRFMRKLANEGPELFFNAALTHLSSDARSNAHRFLTLLVLRQDTLLRRLTDPAFSTRDNAVNLFKRLLEVDPFSDVRLAQMMPARDSHLPSALNGAQTSRALDILDATSHGRRLLPLISHLPESGDPRISAKATLFVGKRVQSPEWTARQLYRSDQRVRANAVEALWGVKSPRAVEIFEDHTEDENNRVAGNSLVGLHIADRTGVVETILTKSHDPAPGVRATACWAMGKIGGNVFYDRLAQLVRDENPDVRSIALRAIAEVRRTETKQPERQEDKPVTPPVISPAAPDLVVPEPQQPLIDLRLDGSSYRTKGR
jgi:hypothetical protein